MKSIKPGRGPSMMGGFMSLLMGVFGIIWTIVVAGMGGGLFALFGVVFILVAVVQAVYHFKNATAKNRYSAFDITDGHEEPDPLNQRFGTQQQEMPMTERDSAYCPYCGTPVQSGYIYCNQCGNKLP